MPRRQVICPYDNAHVMSRIHGLVKGRPLYLCQAVRPVEPPTGGVAPMRRCGATLVPSPVEAP